MEGVGKKQRKDRGLEITDEDLKMLKQTSHGREELSGGLSKNQKRHRKKRASKKEQKDLGEMGQKREEKFEGKERLAESNEPKLQDVVKSTEVKFFPSNEPKEEK
jgi:hypothetical protein